jgi:hypothetical protein
MERILAQNLPVWREDRGRLRRLIILYIIWESHPFVTSSRLVNAGDGSLKCISTIFIGSPKGRISWRPSCSSPYFSAQTAQSIRGPPLDASCVGGRAGNSCRCGSPRGTCAEYFPAWASSSQAAEMTQHPPGFADLPAKVRAAVVSVRVKIDNAAKTMSAD